MLTDASARTLSGLFDDATFTSKSDVKLMRIHGIVPNYMANMASSRGGGVVHRRSRRVRRSEAAPHLDVV